MTETTIEMQKQKKKNKKKHQGRVVEIVIFLEWNKFTYG